LNFIFSEFNSFLVEIIDDLRLVAQHFFFLKAVVFALVILLLHVLAMLILELLVLVGIDLRLVSAVVTLHVLVLSYLVWSRAIRNCLVHPLVMVSGLVLLLLHHLLVLVEWHLSFVLHENLVHVSLMLLLVHKKLLVLLFVQYDCPIIFTLSSFEDLARSFFKA
jgi:hypothetical protein